MPSTRPGLLLLLALVMAACAGPGATASPVATGLITDSPTRTPGPTVAGTAGTEPAASTPSAAATQAATPAPPALQFDQPWAVATLTDVTTGEQFRIADLAVAGKVVFVETMAIWCTSCKAQQKTATEAFAALDPARVEWVAIDVETAETAEALARYQEVNGFPFRYTISDAALSRALADEFGDTVLSPPSVNVIVLGSDGQVTHLLGHHSAAEIIALASGAG